MGQSPLPIPTILKHPAQTGPLHYISRNGDVNNSVVCRHPGCTFHAFMKLIEWK
jgi:hypothetical protein